ncbi:glycosyl transferase family 2 [Dysgonomonas alginatilytica]|uniref:Glycosyl transferase family 2 n=1 Tax=Dysgonomonas alginatilytica TaxID=1605892 RepID=A0A2V3PVA1_9BACT|nr:glycosyltransferase family A protein [Dysgonomonas alginatilytica]PXV68204.1 glycosyl transferase family 2 [Dysgonomonas alginatilytica]
MIYIGYAILFLGFIRLLVSAVNLLTNVYLPQGVRLENHPKVSILIPARNEEANIGKLLADIENLSYTNYEVIVYNDCSTDNTANIVKQVICKNRNIKLIEGGELGNGWLGKNFACNNLAFKATGEYFLFLDADVRVSRQLIEQSVYLMKKQRLKLLSIFPKQIISNKETLLAIPLMNWILLSLLPLILIRWSSWTSFSAANGQFMLFEAQAYKLLEPHAVHKANKVEDIAICRYYKKKKMRVSTILGNEDIQCNMYNALNESIDGFSKNIFDFFGGNIVTGLLFAAFTTLSPVVLYFLLGGYASAMYVCSIVLIRVFISKASKQSIKNNLLYMVHQHFIFLKIISIALLHRKRRSLRWKDRDVFIE